MVCSPRSHSWRRSAGWSTGASRGAACGYAGSCLMDGRTRIRPRRRQPAMRLRSKSLPERGVIAFKPRRGNRVPPKPLAYATTSRVGKPLGERGITRDPLDRRGDRGRVLVWDQQPRFAVRDDIGNAPNRAADHRDAIAHGLEQHDAKPFGVAALVDDRGEYEHVRLAKGAMQIGIGHAAGHADTPVQTEVTHLRLELRPVGPLPDN